MENKLIKNKKILITAVIILSIIVVSLSIFIFYLLYLQWEIRLSEKSFLPISGEPSVSLEELLKSVSAPTDSTATIPDNELKNLLQEATAPKDSNMTVSEDTLKNITVPK